VSYKRFRVVLVRFRAFWEAIVQQFVQQFLEAEKPFSRLQIGCSECAAQSCAAAHQVTIFRVPAPCPAPPTLSSPSPRRNTACASCRSHTGRIVAPGVTASPDPAISQCASDATPPVLAVSRRSRANTTNPILVHIAEKGTAGSCDRRNEPVCPSKIVFRGFRS